MEAKQKDERLWASLCHVSAFAGFIVPFANIVAPLLVWLMKKQELPLVNDQGKESLNFQITMTIIELATIPFIFILIGIPILIGATIFQVILIIVAAIKANEGVNYKYPLSIRFIK